MSKPSLAPFIRARPWLRRWIQPLADWYGNAQGHRQIGLLSDDLIPEESDTVKRALTRLPPKEAYDRVFRLRRAFQVYFDFALVLEEQQEEWTKPEQDLPYLTLLIEDIERENKERDELDAMVPTKKKG
ncbi:MAG: Cytochrome b-c1 complex subunit 7 [Bathelium mastoideum]|nr:MAG: Cytochrome b-c1 complex subunit 7 [Bathelium mastoideum]